jgi:hypothetical protein
MSIYDERNLQNTRDAVEYERVILPKQTPKKVMTDFHKYMQENEPVMQAVTTKLVEKYCPEELKGQRFNEGKMRWYSMVDLSAFKPMMDVLEYGAVKYSPNQWKKGLSMDSIMDSFMRHMIALQEGQEIDPESGKLHIGHMMCNLYFYSYFYMKNHQLDGKEITK